MEPFTLAPTHFLVNNRNVSKSITIKNEEMRELYPMKKYKIDDEDDGKQTNKDVINICSNNRSNTDESLSGLVWNEKDLSATFVDQNAWHIPIGLTMQYANQVRRLDLSFNCLQTLSGIEYFTCLEELVLDNNLLDDAIRFSYNPFMRILSINKNKVTDLERFLNEVTLKLPSLTYLSMLGNPACPDQLSSSDHDEKDYRRYRSYVVHRIPNLKFLDSGPIEARERADAQKRGHYYRLIRLNSDSVIESNQIRFEEETEHVNRRQTTPLPYNDNASNTPKGAFGRLRHRYTGKHSEGNRFIRNHEL